MRKKYLISLLLAISTLAIVPAIAISCSSSDQDTKKQEYTLNLGALGVPSSQKLIDTLSVKINSDNTISDLGLYTNIKTYETLSRFLIINDTVTNQKIAATTQVSISDVTSFDNIISQTINLGAMGKIVGTFADNSWTYQFYKPFIPKTVSQIKSWIQGMDIPTNLDDYSLDINNATNWLLSNNQSKTIYQYIWLYKSNDGSEISTKDFKGAIVGKYITTGIGQQTSAKWTWEYDANQLPIYQNTSSTITESGIPLGGPILSQQYPFAFSTIAYISQYLTIPFLYQFSNPTNSNQQVFIYETTNEKDKPITQKITIQNLGSSLYNFFNSYTITINGTYANGTWSYVIQLQN